MSTLKVILFGLNSTGKSALLEHQRTGVFRRPAPTLPLDFMGLPREPHKLNIWDLSGQPRFEPIVQSYFQNAHVLAYCIDLSQPLELTESKLSRACELFRTVGEPVGKVVLIGTKSDLVDAANLAEKQTQLTELALKYDCSAAFITSAIKDTCQKITEGQKTVSCDTTNTSALFDAISLLVPDPEPLHLQAPGVLEDLITPYPNSDFTKALVRLQDSMTDLSTDQKKSIHQNVSKLIKTLQQETLPPEHKSLAIVQFRKECLWTLDKSKAFNVRHALAAFVTTAIVTLLVATVGFGIGFAAGLWSGPGAFVSGLLAGHAAAVSLTAASVSVGWYSTHRLFKKPAIDAAAAFVARDKEVALKAAVEDVSSTAQHVLPKQLST